MMMYATMAQRISPFAALAMVLMASPAQPFLLQWPLKPLPPQTSMIPHVPAFHTATRLSKVSSCGVSPSAPRAAAMSGRILVAYDWAGAPGQGCSCLSSSVGLPGIIGALSGDGSFLDFVCSVCDRCTGSVPTSGANEIQCLVADKTLI